jgi:cbb3-type cytochrome oxidase maturation protein
MTILYVLLPLALLCGAGAVFAFVWAVESGQLDDLETPPLRILGDDEPTTTRHASDTKPES